MRILKKRKMKNNNYVIKVILMFQVCVLLFAGVIINEKNIKASMINNSGLFEVSQDNLIEEKTLEQIYELNGFLTEKDLEKAKFEFERTDYYVIDNDMILASVNSNIPTEISRVEYNYGNGVADIIEYDRYKNTVSISGNYAGNTQVSLDIYITFCDEDGIYAGEKKISATTIVEVLSVEDIELNSGDKHELKYTNYPEYTDWQYEVSDKNIAIVENGYLIAVREGTCSLYLTNTEAGKEIYLGTITVYSNGIHFESNVVNRAVGSLPYQLILRGAEGKNVTWKSSDESVAKVSSTGVVMPVSQGTVTISAEVVYSEGGKEIFSCIVNVTNPILDVEAKSNLAKGYEFVVSVSGTTSKGVWKSSKESVVSVNSNATYYYDVFENTYTYNEKASIKANKKGTAEITLEIDGIVRSFTINVTNPKIAKDFVLLTKGMKQYIKVTGTNSDSVIKYTSEKTKIATVSKNGLIKAKRLGYSPIYVEVDRAVYVVDVNIGKKKAIKAVMNAMKVEGAIYSQARRMQKGYYDCSSLVWRSYKPAGATFGQKYYAPVAATEAYYCVQKKKTIPKKNIYKLDKLRPGDLMFYKRDVNNGRYKNIYHVVIYMGQSTQIYGDYKYTYGRIIHANGSRVSQGGLYNHDNCVVIGRPFK